MLQTGKTYRSTKIESKEDVYILGKLPDGTIDGKDSYRFAVYFVDRATKDTEVGELEVRADAINDFEEVKE